MLWQQLDCFPLALRTSFWGMANSTVLISPLLIASRLAVGVIFSFYETALKMLRRPAIWPYPLEVYQLVHSIIKV
jgi:hypothetical protein